MEYVEQEEQEHEIIMITRECYSIVNTIGRGME